MKRQTVKFTIWKNRSNVIIPNIVVRGFDGVETPITWGGVTRIVLTILSLVPVVIDSDLDIGSIDYSVNGQLTVHIGDLNQVVLMPEGEYYARLTAFDALNPDGVEIWSEDHPETPVILRIMDATPL